MKTSISATNWPSKTLSLPGLGVFFVFILFLTSFSSALAQEPEGVRYVVRFGDTLSSIALRFDVSVNEIIQASNLSDPDNLAVGDVLIIPGIDWIDGTLVIEDLPLGESYLSIQRRYLLDDASMVRLNRLTSPEQLYVGFPIMLATDRGELADSARVAIGVGTSLLELAAGSGDNPWALAALNQLPGTWAAVPGDVLFTPGVEAAGPGGLPSVVTFVDVQDPGFVQGKTLVINAVTNSEVQLGGEFFGHTFNFFPDAGSGLVALAGIPLEAETGTFDFTLSGSLPDGSAFEFSQPVRITGGGYDRETLTVDLEFLNPESSAAETVEVNKLLVEATPTKIWSGYWGAPHPYINVINSEYGVHRSYNGGIYESYHYGVDFGGGVGIEVWAPAPGKVIFAGPLELRGNATIIEHGWGVYTGYFHQSEILVAVGDQVEIGQVIGLVGGTGRVSGAHLHWEVWVNGVSVEPLDWLARIYP
ncbi:MAG: peptidoglycan DD-metalloendopeptidase family protein [Anaerolineales bacterium]